jgi:ribosomal protein S18 acetylase RimI-like enzyme
MLSMMKANNNHRESIKQCFKTLFDESELKCLQEIKSLSLSYVAIDRLNEVKGFILVKPSKEYAEYEIAYLGVSPRYRCKGYAKILLNLVIQRLAGHSIWLNTLDTNLEAINLYEKMGLEKVDSFQTQNGLGIVYRLVIPSNSPHSHEAI